jgi:hypothetical protein
VVEVEDEEVGGKTTKIRKDHQTHKDIAKLSHFRPCFCAGSCFLGWRILKKYDANFYLFQKNMDVNTQKLR